MCEICENLDFANAELHVFVGFLRANLLKHALGKIRIFLGAGRFGNLGLPLEFYTRTKTRFCIFYEMTVFDFLPRCFVVFLSEICKKFGFSECGTSCFWRFLPKLCKNLVYKVRAREESCYRESGWNSENFVKNKSILDAKVGILSKILDANLRFLLKFGCETAENIREKMLEKNLGFSKLVISIRVWNFICKVKHDFCDFRDSQNSARELEIFWSFCAGNLRKFGFRECRT